MSGEGQLAVLYVDDDDDIRHIVEFAISLDPDIDLRTASSGTQALDLFASDVWRPMLVLLDVMMPGLSGPELMQVMRRAYVDDEAPFVFITAKGREADQTSYIDAGAAAVILKPFDPIALPSQIRRIYAAHRGG